MINVHCSNKNKQFYVHLICTRFFEEIYVSTSRSLSLSHRAFDFGKLIFSSLLVSTWSRHRSRERDRLR